jgi:hypothetical protein
MDDTDKLIDLLCTLAGMIMEDVSPLAVTVGAKVDRNEKIKVIQAAAQDIAALAAAATVVARHARG